MAMRGRIERRSRVCRARIDHAAVVFLQMVFRHAMQEDIEMRADMQMAPLQRARKGKNQRHKLLLFFELELSSCFGVQRVQGDGGWGARGQAACQRGVVVDVELEEVEEGVVDGVDGAVEVAFYAVAQLEGLAGFFTGGEGDVLEVVLGVLDVFTCFSVLWL